MKKKLINGLLMAALFVGFTSSMVSCKDYDDEKLNNIESILAKNDATLRELLAAQKAELEGKISDLETALNACKASCAAFQEQINSKLNDYLTISAFNVYKAEIDGKLTNIYTKAEIDAKLDGYYTKAELDALLDDYYTQAEVDAKLDELKALISEKASVQTIIDLLNSGNNTLTEALNSYFNPIIESYVKNNAISEDAVKALIEQAMAGVIDSDAVKALIAEYMEGKTFGLDSDAVKALINEALVGVNASISDAAATATQALEIANKNKTDIEGLNTIVEGLTNSIIDLGAKIGAAQAAADEAKAAAEANRALINNLQSSYNELAGKVDGLQGDVNALKTMIDDVNSDIATLAAAVEEEFAKADELHRQMLETISGLASSIDLQNATLADFKAQLDGMQEQIDALAAAVLILAAAIDGQGTEIDKLMGTFENTMAKFITGIEINGTYNPLYGYFNTPFNIRSNVLFAYHGNSGDGIKFPTDDPDYYALPAAEQWNTITEGDIEMLGGDLTKVKGYVRRGADVDIIADDGKAGNAGTLYLTVNPTDRDFTGTEFTLINSQNQESAIKLNDIKKSEKVLTGIYTRGAIVGDQSDNGFYEAQATLKLADLEQARLHTDFAGLKDVARDIKNFRQGINFSQLAQTLYNNVNDLIEMNAVKATWADDFGQKSVVSQYAIAATSLKPLSYAFLKEFKAEDYTDRIQVRIESFIDNILGKIEFTLPQLKNLDFNIESIQLADLSDDLIASFVVEMDTTVLRTQIGVDANGEPIYSDGQDITVTIPKDKLPKYVLEDGTVVNASSDLVFTVHVDGQKVYFNYDLRSEIQTIYGNVVTSVEDIKASLESFLDDVNDFIDQINDISIDSVVSGAENKIFDYLESFISRFAHYLKPNKFLQPVMLVKTNDGYARLSEAGHYGATLVGGTKVTFVPTSFNAEILSPAYKKFVAVTNVIKGDQTAQDGNAECKSVLDKANAQDFLAEVIDGSVKYIDVELTPGYLYEVLYSAVDYSGFVVTKKCYLRLK